MANFYPRSPCGERPGNDSWGNYIVIISIHALLAESDLLPSYTRLAITLFLSTLSLRRATGPKLCQFLRPLISIHALLAESDKMHISTEIFQKIFLSTLSLRRATISVTIREPAQQNFYPRSPCGERPRKGQSSRAGIGISIHALLAESD